MSQTISEECLRELLACLALLKGSKFVFVSICLFVQWSADLHTSYLALGMVSCTGVPECWRSYPGYLDMHCWVGSAPNDFISTFSTLMCSASIAHSNFEVTNDASAPESRNSRTFAVRVLPSTRAAPVISRTLSECRQHDPTFFSITISVGFSRL